jgi:hypothetical protein
VKLKADVIKSHRKLHPDIPSASLIYTGPPGVLDEKLIEEVKDNVQVIPGEEISISDIEEMCDFMGNAAMFLTFLDIYVQPGVEGRGGTLSDANLKQYFTGHECNWMLRLKNAPYSNTVEKSTMPAWIDIDSVAERAISLANDIHAISSDSRFESSSLIPTDLTAFLLGFKERKNHVDDAQKRVNSLRAGIVVPNDSNAVLDPSHDSENIRSGKHRLTDSEHKRRVVLLQEFDQMVAKNE